MNFIIAVVNEAYAVCAEKRDQCIQMAKLEMMANLFHHELLLINIDLVVILAEATNYYVFREPSVDTKAPIRE